MERVESKVEILTVSLSDMVVSKFKKNLYDKVTVAGMKEGLSYRIKSIKGEFPFSSSDAAAPRVGEIIQLKHDFKTKTSCSFGWDRLKLFIGRERIEANGDINFYNFNEYYSTIDALEYALGFLELELATDLARQWIEDAKEEYEAKVARLREDYGIE